MTLTYTSQAPAFLWSHVEASVGLIAVCLPAFGVTISKILPGQKWMTSLKPSGPGHSRPIELDESHHSHAHQLQKQMYVKGGYGSVQISSHPKSDAESEEMILPGQPGIMVTSQVTVK